jgi:protein tyrosine phosphatase (PTP) superfamily phosphohydrolase (DUF442 family)
VRSRTWTALFLLGTVTSPGCRPGGESPSPAPTAAAAPVKVGADGLPNFVRLTDGLYSGGAPDGDTGFASLQKLGVKTVISVDGARPDVETAHKYGMRYVHIPFGYDGVPQQQALQLGRAVRDLPGPVYVHCHHGKHRSPAAAAVARLCTDERCEVADALAGMKLAGTDPHYTGLFASVTNFRRPTAADLDRAPADFPEVAAIPALAELMVHVDDRWENLKQARAAGWKTPADHPDVDPPHEALQLAEHLREAGRLEEVQKRPADFRALLADAEGKATTLEAALRKRDDAEPSFRAAEKTCAACHARYRDVPQK